MTAKKKISRKKNASSKKTPGKAARKKAPNATGKKAAGNDFTAVLNALRGILTPYEGRLAPRERGPGYFYLESLEPTYKGRPMFFAGVKAGKSYISYHLLPLYMNPELNQKIPPELKKRMQGKACFNFMAIAPPVFKQLSALTKLGYKVFKDCGWL
jgi:hypothetical protein